MDTSGFAFPKPKDKKRERLPAVQVLDDGREICTDTAAGRREYKARIKDMWERQGALCLIKPHPLRLEDATFEHRDLQGRPRGRNGMWRDDRIVVNGREQNGAACMAHNMERGSRNAVK